MISKIKQSKETVITFFRFQTLRNIYEKIRWSNMSRRRRITFVVLITLLPSLAILLGILLSCIYSADYHTIAIAVNESTQRFAGETYNNQVMFLTLATSLKKFPSGYFQISFGDQQIPGATNYPSINVRTSEGTPLKVDLFVTAKLNISDYRVFYQKYGDDWMSYLKIKIPNSVIRAISNIGFYELTSKAIRQMTQGGLSSFDEFMVNIVNVRVELPKEYLSNVNGTIGWDVFQKNAQLVLLNQSYNTLSTYYTTNNSNITNEFSAWGSLQAQKDMLILNNSFWNISDPTTNAWKMGMNQVNSLSGADATVAQQLLWYYFQSYYNSSFNTQPHQLQFN